MPIFAYTARRGGVRRAVKSRIVADSEKHARALLRESGLTPIEMSELPERAPKAPSLGWLAAFARQLGTLLKAGFPMDRALSVLSASSADESMKAVLIAVDEGVRKGLRLSEAVGKSLGAERGGGFGAVQELTAMIEAGEASGDLANVLLQYAVLLERRQAFRRRLRGALFYPIVVAGLAAAVVLFLFVYVLPTITKLFTGTNVPLPLPTRVLFGLVDAGKVAFWPLLVLVPVAFVMGRRLWKSDRARLKLENWLRTLPFIGELLEKAAIARWARSFGSLLANGVEILYALELSSRAAHSLRIREAILKARPEVAEGVPLARALSGTGVFPPLAVEAVVVGESSGELPQLISEMAEAWETEVEASAERFADMLEPLVLVVMGAIIGAIVLAVLLPIFELNSGIR